MKRALYGYIFLINQQFNNDVNLNPRRASADNMENDNNNLDCGLQEEVKDLSQFSTKDELSVDGDNWRTCQDMYNAPVVTTNDFNTINNSNLN